MDETVCRIDRLHATRTSDRFPALLAIAVDEALHALPRMPSFSFVARRVARSVTGDG